MKIALAGQNQELRTEDIQKLLGTFEVGRVLQWKFPHPSSGDGRVGKLCVSEYREIPLTDAQQSLVVHLTFQIPTLSLPSLTGVDRDKRIDVHISVENLHFTARPKDSQLTISADGNSIIQSAIATHRGVSNDWDHNTNPVRLLNIANHLGYGHDRTQELKGKLNNVLSSYNSEYITELSRLIIERLKRKIKDNVTIAEPPPVKGKNTEKRNAYPFNVIVRTWNWPL